VLLIAHVNYSILRTKAVCMQRCPQLDFAPNNGLNTGFFAVRDNLCVDATITFIDSEDYRLASRPTSALASDTTSTEVRFIQLNVATKRRLALTIESNGLANQSQITVDRVAVQMNQLSNLGGSQIEREEPQKLPKFSTRNSCAGKLLGT
jgi:hypothetical protein